MTLFSNLRAMNWQAKVEGRLAVSLENGAKVTGMKIDTVPIAKELTRYAYLVAPTMFADPKSGLTPSLQVLVANILTHGLSLAYSREDTVTLDDSHYTFSSKVAEAVRTAGPCIKEALRKLLLGMDDVQLQGPVNKHLVAISMEALARFLHHRDGDHTEAERFYKLSLAISEEVWGQNHPEMASLLINLADLYRTVKRDKEALKLEKRIKDIRKMKP